MRRSLALIAVVGASLLGAASVAAQTSGQFSIKSVVGRTVTATVPGPGTLDLHQAPLPLGQGTVVRGYWVIQETQGPVPTAGDFALGIKLNRSGVRQLRKKGHLSRVLEMTYAPEDGTPSSIQFPVRLTKRR